MEVPLAATCGKSAANAAAMAAIADALPAEKVAEVRRILRDDKILRDANGQRVIWYPRHALKYGNGGNNSLDQVRERYQEMKNTNSVAEIWDVLTTWGVVTFD